MCKLFPPPIILYSTCVPLQELYKNLNTSISPHLEMEDSLLFVGKFVLSLCQIISLADLIFCQLKICVLYLVLFPYRSICCRIS